MSFRSFHTSSFNIFYQNIRGFRTKLAYLKTNFYIFGSNDNFVLTEILLSSDISNSELGFNLSCWQKY